MTTISPASSYLAKISGLLFVLLLGAVAAPAAWAYTQDLVVATDLNPDPDVVEIQLAADEALLDVDGDGSLDSVFAFNGTFPGPTIEAKVGDIVIVHFTNNLDSLPTSIHWHGIEGNNASDGTQLTQNELPPGATYTYRFAISRPGTFWYHPHILPTDQTFRGLYGAIVISDSADNTLVNAGILPAAADTKTVILSDVTVCAGTEPNGVCSEANCGSNGGGVCAAGDIPFVQPDFDCRIGGPMSCMVALGTSVLVNGLPLQPSDSLQVTNGNGVRLRVINAAIQRYFRLLPPAGQTLFRVGGAGGLLDAVRLEGGVQGTLDTQFLEGEILIAPGSRADIVFIPTGNDQDTVEIGIADYDQGAGSETILRFQLSGDAPGLPYSIAAGDLLRTHALVGSPLEVLPSSGFASFLDPATEVEGSPLGSTNTTIALEAPVMTACSTSDECHPGTACRDVVLPDTDLLCPSESTSPNCACVADGFGPAIDGVRGIFDAASVVSFFDVPHLASSRYAEVGDLLELKVFNDTQANHPFHMHGFAFQPIRVEDRLTEDVLYTYDYAEFTDNLNIQPGHTLVFRVRLDDRSTWGNVMVDGQGGAAGRWLVHCHIFHHAGLGMISELVVIDPAAVFMDGFESADTTLWSATVP